MLVLNLSSPRARAIFFQFYILFVSFSVQPGPKAPGAITYWHFIVVLPVFTAPEHQLSIYLWLTRCFRKLFITLRRIKGRKVWLGLTSLAGQTSSVTNVNNCRDHSQQLPKFPHKELSPKSLLFTRLSQVFPLCRKGNLSLLFFVDWSFVVLSFYFL